jgi:hypothetical protein
VLWRGDRDVRFDLIFALGDGAIYVADDVAGMDFALLDEGKEFMDGLLV